MTKKRYLKKQWEIDRNILMASIIKLGIKCHQYRLAYHATDQQHRRRNMPKTNWLSTRSGWRSLKRQSNRKHLKTLRSSTSTETRAFVSVVPNPTLYRMWERLWNRVWRKCWRELKRR